jgi:hypothetical protein
LKDYYSSYKKFKKGVTLFQYDSSDPDAMDDDTGGGSVSSNNQGKVKKFKKLLYLSVGVIMVLTLIRGYYDSIG